MVQEVETQLASAADAVQAGVYGGVCVVEEAARERVNRLFSLASRLDRAGILLIVIHLVRPV
ncbi:hypothetical protein [Plantactinospora sp. DSM 117369]